jgi:hypothetical protein
MFSAVALLTPIPRISDGEASSVAGRWSLARAMSFTGKIALRVDKNAVSESKYGTLIRVQ